MPDTATIRTVEHGDASDLPETNWFWRRVFTFILTAAVLLFAWRISERLTDVATLRMALRYSLGIIALLSLLYLAGASTEAITRLFAAVRTTRKETISSGTSPAVVTPERVDTSAAQAPAHAAGDPTQFGGPRG